MVDLGRVAVKNDMVKMLLDAYTEKRDENTSPMKNNFPIRRALFPNVNLQDDAGDMIIELVRCLNVSRADGTEIKVTINM